MGVWRGQVRDRGWGGDVSQGDLLEGPEWSVIDGRPAGDRGAT